MFCPWRIPPQPITEQNVKERYPGAGPQIIKMSNYYTIININEIIKYNVKKNGAIYSGTEMS